MLPLRAVSGTTRNLRDLDYILLPLSNNPVLQILCLYLPVVEEHSIWSCSCTVKFLVFLLDFLCKKALIITMTLHSKEGQTYPHFHWLQNLVRCVALSLKDWSANSAGSIALQKSFCLHCFSDCWRYRSRMWHCWWRHVVLGAWLSVQTHWFHANEREVQSLTFSLYGPYW